VHLPFGGVKATGNGHREGGIGAIDFYTEWKSVYVDYSDKLQKAQIDVPVRLTAQWSDPWGCLSMPDTKSAM
jgi:hypothetical protein